MQSLLSSISASVYTIPYPIKLAIIFAAIIVITVFFYFYHTHTEYSIPIIWIYIIILINLINIAAVIIYNHYHEITPKSGHRGISGHEGSKGKHGKYLTCSYCKTNLYIDTIRKSDIIAILTIQPSPQSQSYLNNISHIESILTNQNIDISNLIQSIIKLPTSIKSSAFAATDISSRMLVLLDIDSINLLLMRFLNQTLSKADMSAVTIGHINRPFGKVGFLPLGDSIIGSMESDATSSDFELNYFMIKGDIVYPAQYEKITSLTVDTDILIIWRPQPLTITENGKQITYYGCGDVANYGELPPSDNAIALISENCLESIPDTQLEFMFITLDISDNLCSIWRTPLNTFATSTGADQFENNSIAYNILNGKQSTLDEYGNVTLSAKQSIIRKLSKLTVSQLIATQIIVAHYISEYTTELAYYMAKTRMSNDIIDAEFVDDMTLQEMMGLIDKAQIHLAEDIKRNETLPKKERRTKIQLELPIEIVRTYDKIVKKMEKLPFIISDIGTFGDIMDELFLNGIDTLIAVDEDGDISGGIHINPVQRSFIAACKLIFPPDVSLFQIKDECIGTYQRNEEKEMAVIELDNVLTEYNKIMAKYKKGDVSISNNWEAIQNFAMNIFGKIGSNVGHIPDYQHKIETLNMDEFTVSRIKEITKLYQQIVDYAIV